MESIVDRLNSGGLARLIPSLSESKREERATSSLLACFMAAPKFAESVLDQLGASFGVRTKVECYTEVVFRDTEHKARPDGLIVIRNGKREWSALVESKVGNAVHKQDQLETYIALARELGADGVITISNQFALVPSHHPLLIPRRHAKYVTVAHFSWLSIVSNALILTENKTIEDSEQAYLLRELCRYLQADASGVAALSRMSSGWKESALAVQNGAQLLKTADATKQAVASWHQLLRFLTIDLSMELGRLVTLVLPRARLRDPDLNFQADVDALVKDRALRAEILVPDAASNLRIEADFMRRTVEVGMSISAPKDKSRASASINWFLRQLKDVPGVEPVVRVRWPRRLGPMTATLGQCQENQSVLVPEKAGAKDMPQSFDVVWVLDLAARFKGPNTFVEDVSGAIPHFYKNLGEKLKQWKPKVVSEKRSAPAAENTPAPGECGAEMVVETSCAKSPSQANPTETAREDGEKLNVVSDAPPARPEQVSGDDSLDSGF